MLPQFQDRYPTGSLISELLQIHQGKFVVRVSAQIEGVTRATGMAADETLEIAEDRARSRALMVLGIEPIVATQASLPLQPTVNELPSKLTKTPQMPEVTSVPCSVTTRSLNSLSYAPATSQQVPAAESFLAPADSMGLSNERLPLTKSTQPPEAPPLRTLTHDQLKPAIDYVHTHLGEDLSLVQIAKVINISPTYFASLFKCTTGISPHQYVIKQRVYRAKLLLLKTDLSIADIALQVGFSSQSHLTQHFKRLTQMTPKQVRSLS